MKLVLKAQATCNACTSISDSKAICKYFQTHGNNTVLISKRWGSIDSSSVYGYENGDGTIGEEYHSPTKTSIQNKNMHFYRKLRSTSAKEVAIWVQLTRLTPVDYI